MDLIREVDTMEQMDIKAFWHDVLFKRRDALQRYFCDDSIIRWHCTNEQFSVEEYIRATGMEKLNA